MPVSSMKSESLMESSKFHFSLSANFIATLTAVHWANACSVLFITM